MTARNFKCPPEQAAEVWQGLGWDHDTPVVHVGGELVGPADLINAAEAFLKAPAAERRKPALVAYAAAARWRKEVGGIVAAGQTIATDRGSQAMVAGAHAYLQQAPDATIHFKGDAGFVVLDAAAMTAIALAVGAHVQSCFAIEAEVLVDIESGAITTKAEIDAAFA